MLNDQNILDAMNTEEREQVEHYAKYYMKYLDMYKLDLERVAWANQHFSTPSTKNLTLDSIESLKTGDTFIYNNNSRSSIYGIVGKNPEKLTIIEAHADIPHIHLKPRFQKSVASVGCCVLETHYYGGIKKYVYQTTPLLMKIVHADAKGRHVYSIGDKPDDPVFTMPDLLAHLQAHQAGRKMADVIKAEEQQVLGSSTVGECYSFRDNFVRLLHERTGLNAEDYPYCEFNLYAAQEAKRVGIDQAVIGAPGQDDGVCVYTSLTALKSLIDDIAEQKAEIPESTCIMVIRSREEVGGNNPDGAMSNFMVFALENLLLRCGVPANKHSKVFQETFAVCADVTSVYDINFPDAMDTNAAVINRGVVVSRYGGARGKIGTTEATSDCLYWLRTICNNVKYQIGTFSRVDLGGGGTDGVDISNQLGCMCYDIGPGVMNMHTWFELMGIGDLYSTYQFYKCLYKRVD